MANFIPRTWHECANPEIKKMYEDVHQTAQKLGYSIDKPRLYMYKSTAEFGRCKTRNGVSIIGLNEKFLSNPSVAMETIVHEYAHALTPKDHHGAKWKRTGNELGKHYNVSVTRTSAESEVGIKITEQKVINYIIECPQCGAQWKYERMTKTVQNPSRYRCAKCKCDLIRIK